MFEPNYLIGSFILSGIGFVYFRYGKSMSDFFYMLAGMSLMIMPYAVTDVPMMYMVGVGIMAVPFIAKKFI